VLIVETLHRPHPRIRAADWRSPLARRLLGTDKYADGQTEMDVSFKPDGGAANEAFQRFRWRGLRTDFKACINTYQAANITEFATLGLACLLTTDLLSLEITEVTRRGERADYWIGDREYVLEVSGQQDGNLETLHKSKVDQLRQNPFGKDGFVCVANYGQKQVKFWHQDYAD
jgi:hypothetical protein